ncbi:MAG: copper amine oxidase N-terminal domain-containing protein, partial [Candidatus Eremiobacteraeota bacterium]|nr:copper amine oxidase N-terminal domain-containing protein [Candidatus Eremiobacteraeota bacterium]
MKRLSLILALAGAALAPLSVEAQQSVSVIVNGQPMSFAVAPMVRAGRVFVPLRGIFERLGASVVYSNGQINATASGRSISLSIGSTQATVNGQPQTIDVAPF